MLSEASQQKLIMDGNFSGGRLRPNTAVPGFKQRNYTVKSFGTAKESVTSIRSKQTGVTNPVLA